MANGEGLTIVHETHDLVEVEWEVRDFPIQPYENGEYMRSPRFWLGDVSMFLDVFTGLQGGWISMSFRRDGSLCERPVSFSCGIRAGGEMIKNIENECICGEEFCCEPQFIEGSDLRRFLEDSNGSLTVVCRARLLDGRHNDATTPTSDCLQVLSKQFEDLFLGGFGSDIKLKVGERVFDVHMLVLRTRCPAFAALFAEEMADNSTAVVDVIGNPDHFEEFLLFIYTGDINYVTSSNAMHLYEAAAKYNIGDLKNECKRRILHDMSVDTVLDVLSLMTRYDDKEISLPALTFFAENSAETMRTHKWELLRERDANTADVLMEIRAIALRNHQRKKGLQVLSKQFEDLRLGGDGSDMKLKVGERVFDVHMLVLRARCPVFAAQFEDEMANNSTAVVDMFGGNPDRFEEFLLFIYTGDISHVTSSNALQLFEAAAKYNIEDLLNKCRSRILSDMSVDTVLDVISWTLRYDDEEISLAALRFFAENSDETMRTDKWELLRERDAHTADVLVDLRTDALRSHQRKKGLQVLSKQFDDLFLGGDGSDIKLKVGERVFDVHMLVLRTRCPAFAALFEDEISNNSTAVVDMIGNNPDHFQEFLLFVYTGDISYVTSSNAVHLYEMAAKYNIGDLKNECKSRILSDMSVDTVLDVVSLMTRYEDEEISLPAIRFFIANAEETLRTDKWELLCERDARTVNFLILFWPRVVRNGLRKNG